ncbi:hypothetical protein ACFLYI_01630, partial [Chloroflexota bacterium]
QFIIRYKSSGNNAVIRNARITAVNLGDVEDVQYNESEAVSSNSTTPGVFQDKAAITFIPAAEGNYSVSMVSLIAQSDTGGEVHSAMIIDDANIDTQIYSPDDTDTYIVSGHSDVISANKTSHTYKVQFKPEVAGAASMKNSRVIAIRTNTCESFSDGAHTTVQSTFTSAAGTLYFWAHGLTINTNYTVCYYDGGGTKIVTDSGVTTTPYGNLSTLYALDSNQSATHGTWHAAVFNSTANPPPDWDSVAGTTGFIMSDSFDVDASAIPEFPTIFTGIAVSVICLLIYIWMRKKRISYVQA